MTSPAMMEKLTELGPPTIPGARLSLVTGSLTFTVLVAGLTTKKKAAVRYWRLPGWSGGRTGPAPALSPLWQAARPIAAAEAKNMVVNRFNPVRPGRRADCIGPPTIVGWVGPGWARWVDAHRTSGRRLTALSAAGNNLDTFHARLRDTRRMFGPQGAWTPPSTTAVRDP